MPATISTSPCPITPICSFRSPFRDWMPTMNTPSNMSECSFRKKGSLKIGFRNPIPRGEYNLIVSTRCGDGRDYALRRIGHPVTVP